MITTGRNLTGVSSKVPLVTLVKTVQEFKPIRNMGVLYNPSEAGSLVQLNEMKELARQKGFIVVTANVASVAGVDSILRSVLPKVDCLYVSECVECEFVFKKIVNITKGYSIPVISQIIGSAEMGVLVSMEISSAEQGQLAGEYVARVARKPRNST